MLLFLLATAASAYLPTALSVALKPLFLFRQAQYFQVFLLKYAPFCMLFAGLGSTNKSATSLLFSFYLTLVLSSPPCPLLHLSFYLSLSGRSGRNCLLSLPVLLGYNGSLDTRFFRKSLSSYISYLLFSRTEGVLSHRNSLTHRFPRFSPRNCALSPRSQCSLSSTLQRTQHSIKLLSFQYWKNRESFLQRLRTLVPGHLSSHSALCSYGLFALLTLWQLSVSLRPLVQTLGSCLASGAPWSSAMLPSFGRGQVTATTRFQSLVCC